METLTLAIVIYYIALIILVEYLIINMTVLILYGNPQSTFKKSAIFSVLVAVVILLLTS